MSSVSYQLPLGYTSPSFPSLFNPFTTEPIHLYYLEDIIKFHVYWSLLLYSSLYSICGLIALIMLIRKGWFALLSCFTFMFVGVLSGAFNGAIIGSLIGIFYNSGELKMNTLIPLLWSIMMFLFTILSQYSKSATYL
eukprot:NODE_475_length_8011_cov_0.074065.p6 type:complete len:137 gc:universal NODE_475_length_8011_cov_0.074065:4853-5263(+)